MYIHTHISSGTQLYFFILNRKTFLIINGVKCEYGQGKVSAKEISFCTFYNSTKTSSKKESERNDQDEPGNNLSQKRQGKKQEEGRRIKKEDGLKKTYL